MTSEVNKGATVVVAMSGGVDSSLAAVLLKERGYEVIGVTMHLWDYESYGGNIHYESACCSVEAMNDARAVCQAWKIPHYVLDLREEFDREVVGNFAAEYLSGRTPNPCVVCNQKIKWEVLFRKAKRLGASYLATGHYARIELDPKKRRYLLKRGVDENRDQSYFLWILTQNQLEQTLFPMGSLTKEQTRTMAREHCLKVAEKRDSQEICFIPDNNYRRFLKDLIARTRGQQKGTSSPQLRDGPVKDRFGKVIGTHGGYPFYTIGQRKGLGIAAERPLYVTRIDPEENAVYVGPDEALYDHSLTATHLNWISIPHLKGPLRCTSKIRHRHTPAEATLSATSADRIRLRFEQPQRAITPGQSVVFYDGEVVIGGGVIEPAAEGAK